MDSRKITQFLENRATASEAVAVAQYFEENPLALECYLPEAVWGQINRQVDSSKMSFMEKINAVDSLMQVMQNIAALPEL